MSLDIRGRLDVEKVKTGKDMPTEEGRGIGYYDDSMAKLANQEEDERLTEAMDTLNLQKTRMLADTRHELKTLDMTLRKLQNQKKLLRRATLENVISGVNKRLVFKSFQSISESNSAESDIDDDDEDLPKSEPKPPEALIANPYVYPGFLVGSTSTESLSSYDNYWLRRRGINPPLSARPASTKVFNEAYINDAKTNGTGTKTGKLNRQKTVHNLNNNNESDSTTNPKEEERIPRKKVRPKTSIGHQARGRRSSLISNISKRDARPHTAKMDGHRLRSRRELTQLTHIDAITSAEREYRRNEWLEAKSVIKADHDRMLRRKVQSFLEKIERDKTKLHSDANGSVTFLDMKIL